MRSARLAIGIVFSTALGVAPAAADAVPLPAEQSLDGKTLRVELRQGQVNITVDPDETPHLRVVDLLKGDETEGYVLMQERGTLIAVSQPYGNEEIAPRLGIEVLLNPGQKLQLVGTDLDLTFRGAAPAEGQPTVAVTPAGASAPGQPRHQFKSARTDQSIAMELRGGTAMFEGMTDLYLTVVGSLLTLERTTGLVDLALQDGEVTVKGHRGGLVIAGEDGRLQLSSVHGSINASLTGGAMSIEDGSGRFQLDGDSADVEIQGWLGSLTVAGSRHDVAIHDSGTANEKLTTLGSEHQLIVSDFAGILNVNMDGGRVDANELSGLARISVKNGADVFVDGVQDRLEIKLEDSSNATVGAARRGITARVTDGRIDVLSARQLELRAERTNVTVREIEGRVDLNLKDSEADLDLVTSRGNSQIRLTGASEARVSMREPCAVRTERPKGSEAPSNLKVEGCELLDGSARHGSSRSGARKPASSVLFTTLSDESSVEVRGRR